MAGRLLSGLAACALVAARHSDPAAVRLAGDFYLEQSDDSFGVRAHGVIEQRTSGPQFYPLPQSTVETYKRLRAPDLKHMLPRVLTAVDYHGLEVIGPYQVEGSRIWFGNHYYDGEGERGVGAFGYFDMKTRRYVLFSPPEIARWETSALRVEADAVWLALDRFGEDVSTSPGGLMRWSRGDHGVRFYPLEFVISRIGRDMKSPDWLLLETREGYALFREGEVQRFRVESTANGKKTAVRIARFPPPPMIY